MKNITIFVIGLICAVNCVLAQDANLTQETKLGIQLDVTWVSKYIWHGQDLYEGRAAFQPSINIDLFGTGFSVNVWSSSACSSGFVSSDEFDYTVAYTNSLFEDTKFKIDYELKWLYYDYTRISSDEADSQEFEFSFSWPDIFSCGIVPNYTLSYLYAAKGDSPAAALEMEGCLHTFGFTYDVNIPKVELPLPLTLSWDITYNDGQGGPDFAHDWAYITWGASSYIKFGPGGFTPAVYYQTTMDKSVNEEDEFWCSFSYTVDF
ncbi:MAG: hypothetical protein WC496_06120 [Phycisphaerae bacterium]